MQVILDKSDYDAMVDALNWASIIMIRGNLDEMHHWQSEYYLPAQKAIDCCTLSGGEHDPK